MRNSLAKEYSFADKLNSTARQSSAERAWSGIARFLENCKKQVKGKKATQLFVGVSPTNNCVKKVFLSLKFRYSLAIGRKSHDQIISTIRGTYRERDRFYLSNKLKSTNWCERKPAWQRDPLRATASTNQPATRLSNPPTNLSQTRE